MSRSGYSDEIEDTWARIRWRGAVSSAISGKRGQAFLRELLAALDAMPVKELVAHELQAEGAFCALGVVGHARGLDLDKIDTENWGQLSREFGIAEALAREIMFENDEWVDDEKVVYTQLCGPVRPHFPEWGRHDQRHYVPNEAAGHERWLRVRQWVDSQIIKRAEDGTRLE